MASVEVIGQRREQRSSGLLAPVGAPATAACPLRRVLPSSASLMASSNVIGCPAALAVRSDRPTQSSHQPRIYSYPSSHSRHLGRCLGSERRATLKEKEGDEDGYTTRQPDSLRSANPSPV
jgi:hypothetical protein